MRPPNSIRHFHWHCVLLLILAVQFCHIGCGDDIDNVDQMKVFVRDLQPAPLEQLRITITYNNIAFDPRLGTDWGFGCLIEGLEKTILFDTGRGAGLFMLNLKNLNIDPQTVDLVFLSHEHNDHIGGLNRFLETRSDLTVFLPRSFSSGFCKLADNAGAEVVRTHMPQKVCIHACSTGEMRSMIKNEHALLIITDRGVVVITGCAHPGIVKMVRRAKALTGKEILLVMGGFHLMHDYAESIRPIIADLKDLGVQYVAPSHCSGGEAMQLFKEAYQHRYIESGVGKIITEDDLKPL